MFIINDIEIVDKSLHFHDIRIGRLINNENIINLFLSEVDDFFEENGYSIYYSNIEEYGYLVIYFNKYYDDEFDINNVLNFSIEIEHLLIKHIKDSIYS